MGIDSTEHDELTLELARRALEHAAPDELVIFEETAAEYFADPQAALQQHGKDEALGFGLDLALLTPYMLAVSTMVLPVLGDILAEAAKQEGAALVAPWLRRLLHRGAAPDDGLSPEQVRAVQAVALAQARRIGLDEGRAQLVADSIAGAVRVR